MKYIITILDYDTRGIEVYSTASFKKAVAFIFSQLAEEKQDKAIERFQEYLKRIDSPYPIEEKAHKTNILPFKFLDVEEDEDDESATNKLFTIHPPARVKLYSNRMDGEIRRSNWGTKWIGRVASDSYKPMPTEAEKAQIETDLDDMKALLPHLAKEQKND